MSDTEQSYLTIATNPEDVLLPVFVWTKENREKLSSLVFEEKPPEAHRRLKAFLRNPDAMIGLVLLALVLLTAISAHWLFPGDPLEMVARPTLWPWQDHRFPLGTDSMGRDVLSGIVHGARISLMVGVTATLIGLGVGVIVGAAGGYFGGRTDSLLQCLIELFQTIPGFILVVVIVAIVQPTTASVTTAIGIITWPTIARLVRAEFRVQREKEYVMAARSLGFSHARIIFLEILPNTLTPIIVVASVMVANAILMESGLSFMGLSDPNVISWGSMIGAGRELLRTAWFLTTLPGLAIIISVLAFNLIGDGLNDALNARESDR